MSPLALCAQRKATNREQRSNDKAAPRADRALPHGRRRCQRADGNRGSWIWRMTRSGHTLIRGAFRDLRQSQSSHRKRNTRDAILICRDFAGPRNHPRPGGNPFANIVCSCPRLSADFATLIARGGNLVRVQAGLGPSGQNRREPPLECGISIQNFRARSVCPENGTPRLDYASHHVLLECCQEVVGGCAASPSALRN